jgi:hypothetical protein
VVVLAPGGIVTGTHAELLGDAAYRTRVGS